MRYCVASISIAEGGETSDEHTKQSGSWRFRLASLSLSTATSTIKQTSPSYGVSGVLEPSWLTRALLLGGTFIDEQQEHESTYRWHMATNGVFPRACPSCQSNEFFTPNKDQISFKSRPLVCEMCRRWHHTSCQKCKLIEHIPSPFFCSKACRSLFCAMEGWSHKGDILFESSNGPCYYTLATPSDGKAFLSSFAQDALRYHSKGRQSFNALTPGNPIASIMSLLSRTFAAKGRSCCDGFMDIASEYDGGRYALGLKDPQGNLTAALTFSVYSTSLPAQVSLCCVGEKERRKGQSKVLFTILEGALEELGIGSIVMDPTDVRWARKLGFSPMHPMDVGRLHMAIPVAFIDAPVMEKQLDPKK